MSEAAPTIQSDQSLANILAALPDAALLPVGWIRKQLVSSAIVQMEMHELTVSAFGEFIRRSPATVRAWCAAGIIPGAYKLPGDRRRAAWRIPATSVVTFRDGLKGPSAPATDGETPDRHDIRVWRRTREHSKAA